VVTQGGDYVVHVKDISGCSSFDLPVTVLGYPKFFTPNNDGYNDTWNIDGLKPDQKGQISVFDRYGKLLKQFSAHSIGWDGTYNGAPLPSTDYWFVIDYQTASGNERTFKAHFSLKR
jgi:gliding motility-associated-like protein